MAAPTSGTITAATALHHYRGLNFERDLEAHRAAAERWSAELKAARTS